MNKQLRQWQKTNLAILLDQLQTSEIDLVKNDLVARGWPKQITGLFVSHYEALLSPVPVDELTRHERRFRDSLERWLDIFNFYQFARELLYVPQWIPDDLSRECVDLLGFSPIVQFVRARPYPLIDQLFISISATTSKYMDLSEEDIAGSASACADILHISLANRNDPYLPVFYDCLLRDVDRNRGLSSLAEKIAGLPKDPGLAIQEYLDHHDTAAVLGMILFATVTRELFEACDPSDGLPSDRISASAALLYAPWFDVLDETRMVPIDAAYSALVERNLMSDVTRAISVKAIQTFRPQIYAPASS